MVRPPILQKGDSIGLVAPARKVSIHEMEKAIACLEHTGFRVHTGAFLYGEERQFSGTDEQRFNDFQEMLDNDAIKAVLCARGGYGTIRLIDRLNFSAFEKRPKWIIGYSDVTVLHAHIQENFGIESMHAAMSFDFSKVQSNDITVTSLLDALAGEPIRYSVSAHELNRVGEASAEIVGGNLSILYSLLGSSSQLNTTGKILFLEDLDEYLYHVDRMMMALKRAGMLDNLAGLVVGGMSDMNDNTIPFGKTAEEIILDVAGPGNYPICFGFPAGHVDRNHAIPLGRKVHLDVKTTEVHFRD